MNPGYLFRSALIAAACITAVVVAARYNRRNSFAANKPSKSADAHSPYVDSHGSIRLPDDYRQNCSHLGSWAVAKKSGETIHEMHDVYTQPETIDAYQRTGSFPDGAVLVKEVRETKADRLTTGHAAWSTDVKVRFVMIKDREQRFRDSEHWGDGWG